MKKLFFAAIVVAMAISCSTETTQQEINEIKFNTNQKAGDDLETLFNTMIASKAYIDLEAKSLAFTQKMNFNGNSEDVKKGEQLLLWISKNLSSTSFKDYRSAVDEYNNMEVSASIVVRENKLFFGNWASSDSQIPGTFHPWQPAEPETTAKNCIKTCWKAYSNAVGAAAANLRVECYNEPEYAQQYVRDFHNYKAILAKDRDKCLEGCE